MTWKLWMGAVAIVAVILFVIAWFDYRRALRRLEAEKENYYERMRSRHDA